MEEYNAQENYINRELSWLDFNMRILAEAKDKNHPLFERMKFLAITGSNLDEFFMVRVASLKNLVHENYKKKDASGMNASEQLEKISQKTHSMYESQYRTYSRSLLPALAVENISIIRREDMNEEQKAFAKKLFDNEIYPILTPMAVDSSRPFPLIQNKVLNICALIRKENKEEAFATVQVPNSAERVIKLPDKPDRHTFILLEEIIEEFLPVLFNGYTISDSAVYRVMRDADIPIDEDDSEDLLIEIEKSLKKRERSGVIRLEAESGISKKLIKTLKEELDIEKDDIYSVSGPIDLTFLNKVYSQNGFDRFKYKAFKPQIHPRLRNATNIFDEIRKGDLFFHHPYDSFESIVRLVRDSAEDENVLAIKQTLYRVSGHSPIIAALIRAAENGKQVTVLMELKARFDEGNNIVWAKKLEKAGCHVIYGMLGLKTHSKITEIVRRDEDGIRRYVHLGTGNYNDVTANFYTDMGILTCGPDIGEDAGAFFNMLSGFCEPDKWKKLIVAPLWLRRRTTEMIEREIKHAEEGKEARIVAKMNSLVDPKIVALLYKASCAGVKIDLIIRGICVLRAGVEGLSENIRVRSIVGRYLEHSRIYYFYNDGNEDIYCASADWMQRNLNRRVEIMFPIDDKEIKEKIKGILKIQLEDNMRAYIQYDGEYKKADLRGHKKLDSMEYFMNESMKNAESKTENVRVNRFIPRTAPEEE